MNWFNAFNRRKNLSQETVTETSLQRVLTVFDLIALGVGSTLGVGIYVIAGEVAKNVAGPAVVVSFILAAFVSILSGLCFAELSARVPKAGSAYIYTYICVGELVAFIIGWCLILEYAIGAASVAKGISLYVDSLLSHTIREAFLVIAPMNVAFLSSYVDFFAFLLCAVLSLALATGVRLSTMVNNFFTFCNVLVVLFFIISGFFEVDGHNWNISKSEIPNGIDGGEGGFAPFGLSGIISGAAICFYAFVGFDCVATTGDEVKNPQRAIPIAIIASLSIVMFAYLGVSSVLTLIVPYYVQDPDAPIPYALEAIGWHLSRWFVGIGALFGLLSSLFGALFPLPRIIYAMAIDGLMFQKLGTVHPKLKTPMLATIVSGIGTAFLAALFNLQQLVGLNAIGTLMTYTIVSVCVIILRFQESSVTESSCLLPMKGSNVLTLKQFLKNFLCFQKYGAPNGITSSIVVLNTLFFCVVSAIIGLIMVFNDEQIFKNGICLWVTVGSLGIVLLAFVLSVASQPSSKEQLSFKMPLVPYLPFLSIFVNIYLMMTLDGLTWVRFSACMIVGTSIYIFYGVPNSLEQFRK